VVFGEGILKDAVGIILFHVISELKLGENNVFSAWTILEMMFNFTYLFVFSVAFGTISGFGLSYLFKKMESFTLFPIK
jgi:NhaP-type Na+/H+ or K+/H+ antiporter